MKKRGVSRKFLTVALALGLLAACGFLMIRALDWFRSRLLDISRQGRAQPAAFQDLRACCWLSSVTNDQACVSPS